MRVLVCGSRDWTDRDHLYAVLDVFHANTDPIEVVIEGGARGADSLGRDWALAREIRVETYRADWTRHRPRDPRKKNPAGAIRNRRMLRDGNPDAVIAFHLDNSPGTADMIALAEAAGIPVYVIRPTPNPQIRSTSSPSPTVAR